MNNLRHAMRQFTQHPGLSLCIVLMLALGIGATTAIFAVFYQVLVQPLPTPEPDRLVNIVRAGPADARGREAFSYPMFRDLEKGQTVFDGIAAFSELQMNLVHRGRAVTVSGVFASGHYFKALGLTPVLGRLIDPRDEPRIDESPIVVLSHAFWQNRLGGDPDIVGETLTINGEVFTIIGVAPPGFAGTQLGVRSEIFVPFTMIWRLNPNQPRGMAENRNMIWVRMFARLAPGISAAEATVGINTQFRRILNEFELPQPTAPADQQQQFERQAVELVNGAHGQGNIEGASQSLRILLGVTLLVLLIVCVNIANLLLARGMSRGVELAVRESMGASRGRLLAQLLTETVLPALLGGLLSLPVAILTLGAIAPMLPARLAGGLALQIGTTAMAFAAGLTLATTLLFGLLPAWRMARMSPALAMKGQAAHSQGGHGAMRLRVALATAQIAFAMILLALAGLFSRSLTNIARLDLGIGIDGMASFSIAPRLSGYETGETEALYDRIAQAFIAYPGVTAVTSAMLPVITGNAMEVGLGIDGYENADQPITANFNTIGPGFFSTLAIPLRAGREFNAADMAQPSGKLIVNERFVREYGLGDKAIGRRLRFGPAGGDGWEIVGVVADAAYSSVKESAPPQIFLPRGALPMFSGTMTFYIRTGVDPDALPPVIPRIVAGVDPELPVSNVITLRRQAQENIFIDRLVTTLSVGFAGLAALLTAIGLYGVLTCNVSQRTRELGLRLALGARPETLQKLVLRQVAAMTAIGIGLGLAVAIGLGRVAESLLFGIAGQTPFIFTAAAALLSIVIFGAAWRPARRASRIAPMEALRYE